MKKTRLFTLLLALMVAVLLCGCKNVPEKTITGDVKNDDQVESGEKITDIPEIKEEEPDVIVDDTPEDEEKQEEAELTPSVIIEGFGAQIGEGGDYFNEAITFADAICEANVDIVAEFTGGFAKSYEFLNEVEIDGYEIYPFAFPEDVVAEIEKETESYYNSYDCYLVKFDITKGDGEYFDEENDIYLMAFGQDPIAGGILSEFVTHDKAMNKLFVKWKKDLEYETYFIREFLSLYRGTFFEGKNYPSEFDFKDSVHLITHLMARCGAYSEPPYTFNEVNEFITESFDGNEGLSLSEISANGWTSAGIVYPSDDPERIYGCSWAHGGTTAEHYFDSTVSDGENTKIITVTLYADYAHFAKSKQLKFTIESIEGELPRILLVEAENDTGNPVAYVSI